MKRGDLDRSGWQGVLADIRRAGTAKGRARSGCLAAEGTRVHERALRAGAQVEAALVARSFLEQAAPRVQRLLSGLREAGCSLHPVPDDLIVEETGGRGLGGILGLVRLPDGARLEGLISGRSSPPVFLAAVEIEDPGNVGALVRTALAGGATAFVTAGLSDPFHPRAVRTSMGSLFKLPIARFETPDEMLQSLRSLGVGVAAAVASGGAPPRRLAEGGRGALAVCVGSEAFGLPAVVTDGADLRVTVPMVPGVDSFSVNAAAAILLYELLLPRT